MMKNFLRACTVLVLTLCLMPSSSHGSCRGAADWSDGDAGPSMPSQRVSSGLESDDSGASPAAATGVEGASSVAAAHAPGATAEPVLGASFQALMALGWHVNTTDELSLYGYNMGLDGLRALQDRTDVTSLTLCGLQVPLKAREINAMFAEVKGILGSVSALKRLRMIGMIIEKPLMESLIELAVTHLHCNTCSFSNEAMEVFAKARFPRLKHLDLSDSKAENERPPIFTLKTVKELNLSRSNVRIRSANISEMPIYDFLDISYTRQHGYSADWLKRAVRINATGSDLASHHFPKEESEMEVLARYLKHINLKDSEVSLTVVSMLRDAGVDVTF